MKLTAIVDSVGRVILGRADEKKSSKTILNLRNPAVVNINVDQQSGQISVQLIPYIFREFIQADQRNQGVSWNFQKQTIVQSDDLVLEDNIINQYTRIFETVTEEITNDQSVEASPVELFDESSPAEEPSPA
jgi:hypothetical protein